MRKFMLGAIVIYASLIVVGYAQMIVPSSENYILTEQEEQILHSQGIGDPLRQGAYNIIQPEGGTGTLSGIVGVGNQISSHPEAQNKVMQVVKNIINYVLGMLALVALVYLLYHGFMMVTAAGDDAQYKKGMAGIKYAAIAIAGIGASWLVVSGIFRLIALLIGP